jgi:hypothetical protein
MQLALGIDISFFRLGGQIVLAHEGDQTRNVGEKICL